MLLTSFFKKILFVYFQREGKRGSNINVQLPLAHPQPGTWPTTRACALTGSWTSNPLVSKLALNPLSHTSQGTFNIPMHRVTSATARENQIFIKLLWETKYLVLQGKKNFSQAPLSSWIMPCEGRQSFQRILWLAFAWVPVAPKFVIRIRETESATADPQGVLVPPEVTGIRITRMGPASPLTQQVPRGAWWRGDPGSTLMNCHEKIWGKYTHDRSLGKLALEKLSWIYWAYWKIRNMRK